jgi:hypothetical protein
VKVSPWAIIAFSAALLAVAIVLMALRPAVGGLVFIAIPAFLLLIGVGQLRMQRAMRRASGHAVATPRTPRSRTGDWTQPPALVIHEIHPGDTLKSAEPVGVATLFLWVFDTVATMSLVNRMNRVGPVHMLRGGGMVTYTNLGNLPKIALGRIDKQIEETEAEVLERIAGFRLKQTLGYYQSHSLVCSDAVWKFALDRLLERCQVVVVDLSDFSSGRAGIAYEIGLLLDRVALDRVVFVSGPETDRSTFRTLVTDVWDTLAPDSPNRLTTAPKLRLAITTSLPESGEAGHEGYTTATHLELDMIVQLVAESAERYPTPPVP